MEKNSIRREPNYPAADPMSLGGYYTGHLAAMTDEGLNAKTDIAVQLALRDKRLDELMREVVELRTKYADALESLNAVPQLQPVGTVFGTEVFRKVEPIAAGFYECG